ncbi:MAG: DUF3015 domain-containing protein [Nitrospira sp.]|nr:DUF3015 domain-containing protein [Nitrospira sp.]
MNKLIMLAVAAAFAMQGGLVLAAGTPDTGPGCGLGKLVFQNHLNSKTKGAQVVMATLNGIGGQTFAISTGTSGCTDDGRIWAEQKTTMFAELNSDALAQEMAQGHGEHLASIATLLGVPPQHHAAFFGMAQSQYTSLAQAGNLSAGAMVKALNDGIAADSALAKGALN